MENQQKNNEIISIKYLEYRLLITNKTITFKGDFSFTIYLKPFNFHISQEHGIIIQEKHTCKLQKLRHPFDTLDYIFTIPNTFLFVSDLYYISSTSNELFFWSIKTFELVKSLKFSDKFVNVVLHIDNVFVVTEFQIIALEIKNTVPKVKNKWKRYITDIKMEPIEHESFLNVNNITIEKKVYEPDFMSDELDPLPINSNEAESSHRSKSIRFYKCFLFIDGMMFYKANHLLNDTKAVRLPDFYFKILGCMKEDEKLNFLENLISGVEFADLILSNNFSVETNNVIEALLEYKYLFEKPTTYIMNKSFEYGNNFNSLSQLPVLKSLLSLIDYFNDSPYRKIFNYNQQILNLFCLVDDKCSFSYNKAFTLKSQDIFIELYTELKPFSYDANEFYSYKNPLVEAKIPLPYKILLANHNPLRFLIKKTSQSYFTQKLNRTEISRILYGDLRLKEVEKIFEEKETVDLDYVETDFEKKRDHSYISRVSANIGQAFFYLGMDRQKKIENVYELIFKKNSVPLFLSKQQKNWPDFINGCNQVLRQAVDLESYADANLIDNRHNENIDFSNLAEEFETIPFLKNKEGYTLAGAIFGLGINNKITEGICNHYFQSKEDVVVFSTIIAYSMVKANDDVKIYERTLKEILDNSETVLVKLAAILGICLTNQDSNNFDVIQTIINEINRRGIFLSARNKGNKVSHNENYRVFCTLSLSRICTEKTRYIDLNDKLCEIILNGLNFTLTKNKKILHKFERDDNSRLEEIFYSALFKNLIVFEKKGDEIYNEILLDGRNDLASMYRKSGEIFYVAFRLLKYKDEISDNIIETLYNSLLYYENKAIFNSNYKILFDTLLITLSLIKNGTSDLNIIRVIRRLIKKTEDTAYLNEITDFITMASTDSKQFGLRFGDILKYKMCLGILCSGCGIFNLKFDRECILNIISSFYVNFPLASTDQEYFNVFRYFIFRSFRQTSFFTQTNKITVSKDEKKSYYTYVNDFDNFFVERFEILNTVEKKICLDILCDYFEKNENRLGFKVFKRLLVSYEEEREADD